MKQYLIDFTGVKTMWFFHEALQKGLDLPDYYGKNLDALWDCLTSDVILPCKVILKGLNKLPRESEREVCTMIEIFKRAVQWYKEINMHFEFEVID